jgi:hypothetical protein
MRAGTRGGRMHRGGRGSASSAGSGANRPASASAAALPKAPTADALGRPDSPQGAAFTHGHAPSSRAAAAAFHGGTFRAFGGASGSQQQEAPEQAVPQGQWCPSPAPMEAGAVTIDAAASPRQSNPIASATTGRSQRIGRPSRCVLGGLLTG